MRILFADDSRTLRTTLGDQMRAMGHEVIEATEGRQAVELFRRQEPDLVVLDVDMPVMNGYETARQIRAAAGDHEWIPIIFLSGNVRDNDVAAGIEAAARPAPKTNRPATSIQRTRLIILILQFRQAPRRPARSQTHGRAVGESTRRRGHLFHADTANHGLGFSLGAAE